MLGFIQTAQSGAPRRPPSRKKKILAAAALAGGAVLASTLTNQQVLLQTTSQPPGIVNTSAYHDVGSNVTVPTPPQSSNGYRFVYWTLNGTRQADAYGISRAAFGFKILENSSAVANYVLETADTDADSVPDWYELFNYGDLAQDPDSDTDNDGVTLSGEFVKGSQPRIHDSAEDGGIIEGGISRRRGEKIAVIVGPGYYLYSESSTPPGVVSRKQYLQTGTRVTTANLSGEYLGHRFAQWKVNGVRQESSSGVALSQVNLIISGETSAVAEYVPSTQDLDADQIPDWFEINQYGTTDIAADSDTDEDGRTFLEEYTGGTQPRIADSASDGSVVEGGISRRRGEKLALAFSADYVRYLEASQPGGAVARDVYFTVGSSVTTANPPLEIYGHKFVHWTINGQRQESAAGIAQSQVTFNIGADTTALALYLPATQDLDADQIPDWYEIQQYGNTLNGSDSDTDNDGVTLIDEYIRGTQPRIYDSAEDGGIVEGGVSRRRAEKLVVNLQFFPAERRLLLGNDLSEFFGDPYDGIPGAFRVGPDGTAAPALGDIDGDGDFDMILGGAGGVLRAFENRGSPLLTSFAEKLSWIESLGTLPSGALFPALGDWNIDGRADLALGTESGQILFRKSNGLASAPSDAGSMSAGSGAVIPAFLPTSDGSPDLLVLKADGTVAHYVYSGDALAPYSGPAASESFLPEPVTNGRGLSVADANGDGILDILASDSEGRMWLFHGQAAGGYILNSKVWGGAYAGMAQDLRASVVDLNGDGSPDIVGGTADGSLIHLRNPAKKLRIEPPLKTVLTGETIPFRSIDNDGSLRWDFARNASGGTIDAVSGLYTAGPNPGVDGIIVRSSRGLTGSAWVNVLEASDGDELGKSIIVAGRRNGNDPVWPASRWLANRAHEVLRYRGYQPADIAYLSHEPRDAGVIGAPTRAALQEAIRNAGNEPTLVLYLVDHGRVAPGGTGDGLFLLGPGEQFSGTELDSWLDEYQTANPQTDVIVVLEFCYSQRVAEKLADGNPPRRVVYASADKNQVAHMVAGGSVSYSAMFWSELSLGKTFDEAHEAALLAMQSFQSPKRHDPHGLGSSRGLGLGSVSQLARPSVGNVSAPQTLTGSAKATIWASDVNGSFQSEKVWAVVVPPGYQPDGDAPVVDLPELQLVWNPSNQRYEVEYGGFTEGGPDNPYTVFIYARDVWGQVSMPAVTSVTQTGSLNRVVIVAHRSPSKKGNSRKIEDVADFAHETALLRRVPAENIRYLSGESGTNERITHPATAAALQSAITDWALPSGKNLNALTLYLVGEASQEGLFCANGDVVTPAQLNGWLNQLQAATGCIVQLIVDSDYSGRFVTGCASAVYERVIIASCGPDQEAPGASEWAGLSRWFWQAIAKGQDLRSSFGYAADVMRWLGEVPFMLDDDGDGTYNRARDGFNALASFIGAAFVTASDPPHIGLASKPITASLADSVNIWVADVVMPDGNPPAKVWADVLDPAGEPLESIELIWNDVYERYDGFVDGFTSTGRHVALVYAGDPGDPRTVSPAAPVQIFVATTPFAFGGGVTAGLQLPLTGQSLDATIEAGGAPFEVLLPASPGEKISIEVFGVSAGRNVALSVLAPDGTELARRDDWGSGFGEEIWAWEPTATANYRVRVSVAATTGRTDFSLRGFLQQDTLDVGARGAQSILFNMPAQWGLDQGPLDLELSASSGLLPELDLLAGAASLQSSRLIPAQEGSVTLRARQNGNHEFAPAPHITRTVDIVARGESFEEWLRRHFGQNADIEQLRALDSDKDGRSNLQEYKAATDPRDALSLFHPSSTARNGAAFEVRWDAKRGIKYRVLSSTNLATWQEVPDSRRTGSGATETVGDTDIGHPRKFYRIEVVE